MASLLVLGHVKPAGHGVHRVACARLYLPVVQGEGRAVVVEQLEPAGQGVQVPLPVSAYVPAGQLSISAEEVDGQNLPAGQRVHEMALPTLRGRKGGVR